MTYTSHGHHIDGTTLSSVDDRPPVARCGGPRLCKKCTEEASSIQFALKKAEKGDLLKQKFTRKRMDVEAVLVTEENIHQVAGWCKGSVIKDPIPNGKLIVVVPVKRVRYPQQREAHVGMWVVWSEDASGFKVYKDSALRTNFEAILDLPEVPTIEVVQEQLFDLSDLDKNNIHFMMSQGASTDHIINCVSLSMRPSVQKYIDSINKEN